MGFVDWAKALFFNKDTGNLKDCVSWELQAEVVYKKLAIETCIDLIAKALARCEFKTFEEGKSLRSNNYFLLNVEPNINQNATEFWYNVFHKYLYDGECLIVMVDNQLLLADSYDVTEYAIYPNVYKNVTVKEYTFELKPFYEKDVFHFKLTDTNMRKVIDSLYNSYGKLLSATINSYKRKNNKRWFANGDFMRAQDDDTQKEIDKMLEEQLKDWFNPDKEAVVFQKQKGYEMEDASDAKNGVKADSSDIRNMIDDIFNFVSMGFHVPRTLLKGDVAEIEANIDSFIMFALNPIAEIFSDEFNRKMYKRENFIKRSYMQIDTSKIKLIDLAKLSTAIDKLFAVGGLTINEVLEELGKNPIAEKWADERYITKNYQKASMTETVSTLQGGES